MKTPEKTLNLKSSKLNNKLKGALLTPIFLETNKQVKNIIGTDFQVKNEYNSPNKENVKHQPKYSRNDTKYKTFSENKYNFAQKFLKENNKNLIKSESKKRNTKIYLNTKEFEKEKKVVINSIKSVNIKNINEGINNVINLENEADNTFSKDGQSIFRNNMQMDNSDKDKNNIAIKLMKNKKQVIDEFNLNYIKQYYPTLNLYKNYYNKKLLENKEKEINELRKSLDLAPIKTNEEKKALKKIEKEAEKPKKIPVKKNPTKTKEKKVETKPEINILFKNFIDSIPKIQEIFKNSFNNNQEKKQENDNNEKKPIHYCVRCDGCKCFPIRGIRYKCAVCNNFDYCEACEEKFSNVHQHPFIKINKPDLAPKKIQIILPENMPEFKK
jgi:hypothetical protein